MKKTVFIKLLDSARQWCAYIEEVEKALKADIDTPYQMVDGIFSTLEEETGSYWEDNIWDYIYDYKIPTTEVVTKIETLLKEEKEGEIFDKE